MRGILYFVWVFIVGSIPIIGPFLVWNLGVNFGKEYLYFQLTGRNGGMNL